MDAGLDLFDDWDDGKEPVRVRPSRPRDEAEPRVRKLDAEPRKRERRRRREVLEL